MVAIKPGDWICDGCASVNFASREACFRCKVFKPVADPGPTRSYSSGLKKSGGDRNAYGPAARASYSSKPAPYQSEVVATPKDMKDGDWVCPDCGINNFSTRVNCFKCGIVRGGMKDGDWICRGCKQHNFARNQQCKGCQAPRSMVEGPNSGKGGQQPAMGKGHGSAAGHDQGHGHGHGHGHSGHGPGQKSKPANVSTGSTPGLLQVDPMMMAQALEQAFMAGRASQGLPSAGLGIGGCGGGCKGGCSGGSKGGCGGKGRENNYASSKGGCSGKGIENGYASYKGGGKGRESGSAGRLPAAEHPMPSSGKNGMGGKGGQSMKEGDWMCPSCDNHNFASRTNCKKCDMLRPGYRPGDWTCKACVTHNFASREACFKCQVPRPH